MYKRQVLGPPRKGIKLTYTTDTRPTNSIRENAKGSDLFIFEGKMCIRDRAGTVQVAVMQVHVVETEIVS